VPPGDPALPPVGEDPGQGGGQPGDPTTVPPVGGGQGAIGGDGGNEADEYGNGGGAGLAKTGTDAASIAGLGLLLVGGGVGLVVLTRRRARRFAN
jgi:LPXTG-motif cell wall-anchored protein